MSQTVSKACQVLTSLAAGGRGGPRRAAAARPEHSRTGKEGERKTSGRPAEGTANRRNRPLAGVGGCWRVLACFVCCSKDERQSFAFR